MAFTPLPYSGGGYWERMADLNLRGSEQEAANIRQNWQTIGSILPQTVSAIQDFAQQKQQMEYYETVRERQQHELEKDRRAQSLELDMEELTAEFDLGNGMIDYTGMGNSVNQRKGADFEGPTQAPRLRSSPGAVLNAIRPRHLNQSQVALDMFANEQRIRENIINQHRVPLDDLVNDWDRNPDKTEAQKAMEWQKLRESMVSGLHKLPNGMGDDIVEMLPDYSGALDFPTVSPTGSGFAEPTRMEEMAEAQGIKGLTLEDFDEDVIRGLAVKGRTYADLANQTAFYLNEHKLALEQGFFGMDPSRNGNVIMGKVRDVLPHTLFTAKTVEDIGPRIETYLKSIPDQRVREFIRDRLEAMEMTGTDGSAGGLSRYKERVQEWKSGELIDDTAVTGMSYPQAVWFGLTGSKTTPAANTAGAYQLADHMDNQLRRDGLDPYHVGELLRVRRENAGPPDTRASRNRLNTGIEEVSELAKVTRQMLTDDDAAINASGSPEHLRVKNDDGEFMSKVDLEALLASDEGKQDLRALIHKQEREAKEGVLDSEAHNFNIVDEETYQEEFVGFLSEPEVLLGMMESIDDQSFQGGNVLGEYSLAIARDRYMASKQNNEPLATGSTSGSYEENLKADAFQLFSKLSPGNKYKTHMLFLDAMGDRSAEDVLSEYNWSQKTYTDFYGDMWRNIMGRDFFTQDLDPLLGSETGF